MSSLKETMQTFAVNQALKYIEGDPGENLPKLMDMVDKFSPDDWYVEQRKAIRTAITEKNNWYRLVLKLYELDPGVRKAFFQNFLFNASFKGSAIQNEMKEKYGCNIPWAIHLGLQSPLHRLLGGRVRQPAELFPGDHRLHHPPGQGAGYLHVHLHRR